MTIKMIVESDTDPAGTHRITGGSVHADGRVDLHAGDLVLSMSVFDGECMPSHIEVSDTRRSFFNKSLWHVTVDVYREVVTTSLQKWTGVSWVGVVSERR